MRMIKNKIKKILPEYLVSKIKNYQHNIVYDVYNTNYKRVALLSYITAPFKNDSFAHTNYYEARSWAKALFELGYDVDVVHFDRTSKIDLERYDLICGFGDVFQDYFESSRDSTTKTIYYGTGMHVCHQNQMTLQRVKEVHEKKGVWLGRSARFVEKTWTHQTTLVDGIIALGNDECAKSYRMHYDGEVISLLPPFYKIQDADEIIRERKQGARTHFLWFGGSGLIHKGLDLLLDYFSKNSELTLHICGPLESEPGFIDAYGPELGLSNIIAHGFVDIHDDTFTDILKSCSFVIFPSCSEGGAASVLTAVGNGGLIPIITRETSISTGFEFWIESLDEGGVDKAIQSVLSLDDDEILALQLKNLGSVGSNHAQEQYYAHLKRAISDILGEKDEM